MYTATIRACYVGNLVGSLVVNLSPLLFVTLMQQYDLSFEQVGRLVLVNFFTQIITDLVFSRPVDRYGVRPFIAAGHALVALGFILFAFAESLIVQSPYAAMLLATVVFSCGGGLLELLLSAIIQSIPGEEKAAAMSLFHSFYAWGFIAVIIITTIMLSLLSSEHWPWAYVMWALVPLANSIAFLRVPLAPQVAHDQRTGIKLLTTTPYFLLLVLGIAIGGAAEVTISQWTSTYAETTLGLSKQVGDLVGLVLFALLLGIGRMLYGLYGKRIHVWHVMLWGSVLAAICYVVAALSPSPFISLLACAFSGLGVALLWPGSITMAAHRFPLAGASLFALLAAGGDTGSAIGPWLIGFIADTLGQSTALSPLRTALLTGTIYPVAMFICLLLIRKGEKNR